MNDQQKTIHIHGDRPHVCRHGSRNGWFSLERNLERVRHCISYTRAYGFGRLFYHLRTEVFHIEKPSRFRVFFSGLFASGCYSLQRGVWRKSINEAKLINVVVTYFLSSGGASLYLRRRLEQKDVLTILVRNTNAKHVVCCQAWKGGSKVFDVYADGLRILATLPRLKCREIFVNQLVGWQSYLGDRGMTPSGLRRIFEELTYVKEMTGAKFVFPIHDYFYVCPRLFMVDRDGDYCGMGDDPDRCNCCCGEAGFDIAEWRGESRRLLSLGDEVICFSEDSKARLERIFPLLPHVSVVRHQPIEHFEALRFVHTDEVVIGVVGAIIDIKGASHVMRLLDYLDAENLNARIVVVGDIDHRAYTGTRLTVTGAYRHFELPNMLERHGVNVAYYPGICPETFGFVVQELIMLGLPIVCFDLGAQAELAGKWRLGRLIDMSDPPTVWKALKELHEAAQSI